MRDLKELMAMLQRLDEGEPRESPVTFDYKGAIARFHETRQALENEFQQELSYETESHIQDAAFHSYVALPSPLGPASIRFSNFGNLVAIWGDQKTVPPEILQHAIDVLERHGYVYVPFSLLEQRYYPDQPEIADWWERFFGYA